MVEYNFAFFLCSSLSFAAVAVQLDSIIHECSPILNTWLGVDLLLQELARKMPRKRKAAAEVEVDEDIENEDNGPLEFARGFKLATPTQQLNAAIAAPSVEKGRGKTVSAARKVPNAETAGERCTCVQDDSSLLCDVFRHACLPVANGSPCCRRFKGLPA